MLAAANADGRAVVVEGGGTRNDLGAPPDRVDLTLATGGLSGIVEHHRGDFTAEVRAGTPLAALNRELAPHGQFLPLDPPLPDRATIGGVIAAGDPGYRRAPGTRPGDLLLGFRAVLGDGTPIRSGGRVVKNVTGYELGRLFTGSLGTLGVLTRVTVRLRALPEASRTALRPLSPETSVEDFTSRVTEGSGDVPEAVAVASPGAGLPGLPEHDGFVLAVRTEGLREEAGTRREDPELPPTGADRLWAGVRDFPVVVPRRLGAFGFRGAGSRTAVLRTAWKWAAFGPALALPDIPRVFAAIPSAHRDAAIGAARDEGVTVVVESAPPGEVRQDRFHPPPSPSAAALMRRIRIALDPRDTLAPGRFPWTR